MIYGIKNPRPYKRDEVNRGTTLIPRLCWTLGLRNVQIRHSLLSSVQEYSSRGKFNPYLNQRELTAGDSLSLLENSSLLNTIIAFLY